MEIHRLKTMPEGYDQKLFNELYAKTHNLRESLIYQIDERRFGVTKDELRSWFDDKFLFVFQKYYGKMPSPTLLGYLINSLKVFKFKVLRRSYQLNNSINLNTISMDDLSMFNSLQEDPESDDNTLYDMALDFLKSQLSREAWALLQIQLNPPIFIASKVKNLNAKIPGNLILEFLGEEVTESNLDIIRYLRKEINSAIEMAHAHFNSLSLN